MLRPAFFIAFSGHRPENASDRREADLSACTPRIREVLEALRDKAAATGGDVHLVSSLAAGADIIACETALGLDIPLHLVLPKPEAEFLQTFYHKEPEKNLDHWLPRARKLLATVRPEPDHPEIAVKPKHSLRVGAVSASSPDCYAEVNTRLLENADLLLTLSTGKPSKSIAGTTHFIHQAEAIGIPVLNLNPADPPSTPIPTIPREFAAPDSSSLRPFHQSNPHLTCEIGKTDSPFRSLIDCLRTAAGKSAKWYRRASALAIGSHAAATILAAAAASFYYTLKKSGIPQEQVYLILAIVAGTELVLVFFGWWLERRLHSDNAQKTWLNCRFARELLRSIEKSHCFLDPLFPEVGRHQPDWRRFAVTTGLMLRAEKPVPANPDDGELICWRDEYLKNRIRNQETFFRISAEKSRQPATLFRRITHAAGLLALLVVLFACGVKVLDAWQHSHAADGHDKKSIKLGTDWITAMLLLFLPILMPLLASLGASFGAVFDYDRRHGRYHDIADNLAQTAKLLPTLSTRPDITSAVRRTEEVLIDELIEWFSAQKSGLGH